MALPDALSGLLKCPGCGGALDAEPCPDCGFAPAREDGVPVFPFAAGTETYQLRMVPMPEVEDRLAACFGRHGRGQAAGVYHLDGAHAAVLGGLPKGARLLEIGCGGGQMRDYIRGLGLGYAGTDVSTTNVHRDLRGHGGPDFISDAHCLPVRDGAIDVVYSAAVTQYLAAPARAFQEIFRALKPGGQFLSNCCFLEPWTDGSFFHVTPNGAAALLLAAGFEIEAMWPSFRYTGYQSLLRSGSRTARAVGFLGGPMRVYAEATYTLKRLVRGAAYGEQAYATDLARTAGGFDWIARKPGAAG